MLQVFYQNIWVDNDQNRGRGGGHTWEGWAFIKDLSKMGGGRMDGCIRYIYTCTAKRIMSVNSATLHSPYIE